jgi:chromosome segregation and condensation protein ScpB
MANGTQSDRLDRIENKLDKLSEAIVSLARAEVKIQNMEKFLHQQMDMMVEGQKRLEAVEKSARDNATTINVINKLFWIVMAALAASITGMLVMQ